MHIVHIVHIGAAPSSGLGADRGTTGMIVLDIQRIGHTVAQKT